MPSSFAWLDHSENDRRKALDVVDLFREQDTRDELGIGTVRDALADALFPGISTIQTRAKYLLFIPWIYRALEEHRTKSRDVARLARKHEIELIYELIGSDDTDGVIGRDAKAGLQRLPSAVYWSGLETFGIRRFPGSQDQYHRSLDDFYRGRLQAHASAEDGIVELYKPPVNWHDGVPVAPEDFPLGTTLELDYEEAEYLRQQIMANVPGTFLAFLVDQSAWWDKAAFPWQHPQVGECSRPVRDQLRHARLFSLVMLGAALLYNLMLAEKRAVGPDVEPGTSSDLVDDYRKRLEQWHADVKKAGRTLEVWAGARDVFWQSVHSVNLRIPVPTLHFINSWIDLAMHPGSAAQLVDSRSARDLIHHRERRLKRALARLDNVRALEMWGGKSGTQRLSYRWPQAQVVIQDILLGLGEGPG
jgi:hypothetical protein